jgi:hypothetical protein
MQAPGVIYQVAHLAKRGCRVKGSRKGARSQHLIVGVLINLLNLLADFARSEFHSRPKHGTG